jgi:hypothetical protein
MRINFERFRRLVPTDPNNTPQVPEEEEEDSSSSSSSEDY